MDSNRTQFWRWKLVGEASQEVVLQKEQKERVIPYPSGMVFNSYLTLLQSSTYEQLFEDKEEDKNLVLKREKLLSIVLFTVYFYSNLVLWSKIFHLFRPVNSGSQCLFPSFCVLVSNRHDFPASLCRLWNCCLQTSIAHILTGSVDGGERISFWRKYILS